MVAVLVRSKLGHHWIGETSCISTLFAHLSNWVRIFWSGSSRVSIVSSLLFQLRRVALKPVGSVLSENVVNGEPSCSQGSWMLVSGSKWLLDLLSRGELSVSDWLRV